jgi:hypothetical protein
VQPDLDQESNAISPDFFIAKSPLKVEIRQSAAEIEELTTMISSTYTTQGGKITCEL